MMYAQYCRIESRAGGVCCTRREFIREARKCLKKSGKSRANRDARHAWLLAGLAYRGDAQVVYGKVITGRFGTPQGRRKADAQQVRRTMFINT